LKAGYFRAPLEALDDPARVMIKTASAHRNARPNGFPRSFETSVKKLRRSGFKDLGSVPTPGHLMPFPSKRDIPLIHPEYLNFFAQGNGFAQYAEEVHRFVIEKADKLVPIMFGIDHSSTFGALKAVAEKCAGPLALLVLDAHFDAIPVAIRSSRAEGAGGDEMGCGNFLDSVFKEKLVRIDRAIVAGVSDYPGNATDKGEAKFKKYYEGLVRKGTRVIKKSGLEKSTDPIREAIGGLKAKHIYISIDADVIAGAVTGASRFYDSAGLGEKTFLNLGGAINDSIKKRGLVIAGMDVMELDPYKLGLKFKDGRKDRTLEVILKFIERIIK